MKKVLGWAVLAMLVGMGAYFGLLRIGMPPVSAALAAATVVAVTTVAVFEAFCGFVAMLAVVATALVSPIFSGSFAAVLVALLVGFAAFHVASKLGIDFKWVYLAYLIEGMGIYATLKLGLWQPAAIAALFLGVWWLVIRLAEKVRPAVSI
ncbi:MAG: hypothetical protein IT377_34780 [Polyangiaceae bacterium]|nr:hypothetical protein [Polyangiaceae bacterium]